MSPRPEGVLDDEADPGRALEGCVDWWGGPKRKGRVETDVAWKVTADEVKERGYNLDIKNPHTCRRGPRRPRGIAEEARRS